MASGSGSKTKKERDIASDCSHSGPRKRDISIGISKPRVSDCLATANRDAAHSKPQDLPRRPLLKGENLRDHKQKRATALAVVLERRLMSNKKIIATNYSGERGRWKGGERSSR